MAINHHIAALLTPPGISAVAVIGLQGPQAWEKIQSFFQARKPIQISDQARIYHGKIKQADMGDEIVLSLSGCEQHQILEMQCHGGPGIVQFLLTLLHSIGFQITSGFEWLELESNSRNGSFLWSLLPKMLTRKTASILLDQCQGAWVRAVQQIEDQFDNPLHDKKKIRLAIDALARWVDLGRHLLSPWRVILIGAPNAGKSSLLNALLGFDRAITSPIPGTTRDVLSATLVWNGFPFELIDTAGIHAAADHLEAQGIERSVKSAENADIILSLVDLSDALASLPSFPCTFRIGAKSDLPRQNTTMTDFNVSAQTGTGLESLLNAIFHHAIPEVPSPGQGIPIAESDRTILQSLQARLANQDQ